MARKSKKRKLVSKIFTIILLVINILFIGLTILLNVVPLKYFLIILGVLVIIDLLTIKFIHSKKKITRLIGIVMSLVISIVMLIGAFFEFTTLDFFGDFGKFNYKTLNYNVLVLKSSKSIEIKDLEDKKIGILVDENIDMATKTLSKSVSFKKKEYSSIEKIVDALLNKEIDAMVIEESKYLIISEENEELNSKVKEIYKFSIDIEVESIDKKVDVTKDAFNIYISGIDSYGKITSVSRSDVNIVVTVNPNTNEIVLTSIPRDYYVQLHGTKGYKDKLTHAGVYGIEKSVQTIEDLLDIDINYYLKVNFTSLIKVVNELGGIKVNSNYSFTSRDGYHYQKGENYLNGKEALSFVRERKAFKDGDRVRGENQQLVLEAIINKALSPTIITKYSGLLNSLEGSFVTNMEDKDITSIIKKQLENNESWSFETINLNGTDSYDYTYTHSASKLYVMVPDPESVSSAQEKLHSILN
ncbi:MAG: LCP family protein [Bacilli bacterium]|nr:LCP family protein [Bacilli bacterium]